MGNIQSPIALNTLKTNGVFVLMIFFKIFLNTGLPIFVLSLGMVYWLSRKKPADSESEPVFFEKDWLEFGGGFYGMMALLSFFTMESADLLEDWNASESLFDYLIHLPFEFWFDFGVDSLVNFIMASIWFVDWFGRDEGFVTMVIALTIVYGCYLAANRVGKTVWQIDLDQADGNND